MLSKDVSYAIQMAKKTHDLTITNARENNLKGLNLAVPHDSFTVVTGLSGSGKSSLAFGTVYAEGQRRYIETFSPYTRQFFDKVKKPDVDLIEHVRPAIAIQQRNRVVNSRSTVGSITNINDYLKILWANLATPICPICNATLESWDSERLSETLIKLFQNNSEKTFLIAAKTLISEKKKDIQQELTRLESLGFARFLNMEDGTVVQGADIEDLKNFSPLYVVLDRVRGGAVPKKRLREAIDQAFSLASGVCSVIESREGRAFEILNYNNTPRCKEGHVSLAKPRPSLFSFNHPIGACPKCKGFGANLTIDLDLCIPDKTKSISEKCIVCWSTDSTKQELKELFKFCEKNNIPIDAPWEQLAAEQQQLIATAKTKEYWGILRWFEWLEKRTYKMHVRVFLSKFRTPVTCTECEGSRLKRDALAFKIKDKTIADIWGTPIGELTDWIETVQKELLANGKLPRQIKEVFTALTLRLRYLVNLGLTYLTLDRQARTLSGGEVQRVNLASALGSDLISTQFVLDEPSVGLHSRDTDRLIQSVEELHKRGNSLLVVEHDPEFIAAGERVLELGPGSGATGGEVVFHGEAKDWKGITFKPVEIKDERQTVEKRPSFEIHDLSSRNLKNLSVKIPLNSFVCLTGVSGSGKSTLAGEIAKRKFPHIQQILHIDQSPLAKSPRANIATYSKIWDIIRERFAATEAAKERALTKSSFSFNVNAGRCPACEGAGYIREDMQFLSDVFIQCEVCLGKRFQQPVLEVQLEGLNVYDFLQLTIDDCVSKFTDISAIVNPARTLQSLGLGSLTLGHPLSELSGGEAQRLKLVPFVEQSEKRTSLLIFDEPTTGLHVKDVEKLVTLFRLLVKKGHSILCIEHNLPLVLESDWVIDLGPEGGEGGGEIIFQGTPKELLESNSGHTSKYLNDFVTRFLSPSKNKNFKDKTISRTKRIPPTNVEIRGARVHNLKNIDVNVPLNKIVGLTGVSGSGKSSIAKDIIYAEGQRRYLDCLSPYARQFIKSLERPDVDALHNVLPTICIYQHTFQPGALSTVGTMSEVYNFLRLLFAKTATQFCPDHPTQAITGFSPTLIAERILNIKSSSIRVLAPIIKLRKGNHRAVIERAVTSEIAEVRVDGVIAKPSKFSEGLEKAKSHSIEFVIARFNPKYLSRELLRDAVAQALSLGGGELIILSDLGEEILSTERSCPECGRGFFKPDPEDLSFHSKRGRCPKCSGTGFLKNGKICSECDGARIAELGRNLKLFSHAISDLSALTPTRLIEEFKKFDFDNRLQTIAEPIIKEIISKLQTLELLGLDQLPLNRDCLTLSGGELQRLRLATAMGSPLTGVLYIFDEPSVGLHPLDNARVADRLRALRDAGNSLIVIEHDEQSILDTDHIIEVGPGGGTEGGEIVYSGATDKFLAEGNTATATEFRDGIIIPPHPSTLKLDYLRIENATCNNIKNLSASIPLGRLVTVAGVSGAGKSSLVHGIITKAFLEGKKTKTGWALDETLVSSATSIDRLLPIDQKPIGANSRSTPASYLKIWDEIRKLFAATIEAKSNGWGPDFFSYNTGKGRCQTCKGLGAIKLEMSFLSEATVTCDDCGGSRYSEAAQSVKFLGLTISDVLRLTFDEAKGIFTNHRKIHQQIRLTCELGLGYLSLGQGSSTLSGGESQRIKLAAELGVKRSGHTLYVLDEPTTGLHKRDVKRLLQSLRELVDRGNSVLTIEHDSDFIQSSDYVIELGPGAGDYGGKIIFEGSPMELLKSKTPWGDQLSRLGRYRSKQIKLKQPIIFGDTDDENNRSGEVAC